MVGCVTRMMNPGVWDGDVGVLEPFLDLDL
jgi:hypothetical protein